MNNNTNKSFTINLKKIGLVIIVLLCGFSALKSFKTVETGQVAVVSRLGKLNRIEGEGAFFIIPFIEKATLLTIRENTYYFEKGYDLDKGTSLEVSTKDMQTINVELSVQVSITDPEKLYRSFRNEYPSQLINPRTREIVQSTVSKYTIEEFVSKRAEISSIIYEDLKDDLEKYGILLSNISITNHDFSDEYESAVEQKKVAEQSVERAKAEQEKLLIEQENKVKLAELELKQKEIEAQANKIETESLSDALLRKMTIQKWDGKLPTVTDSNSSIILDSLNAE